MKKIRLMQITHDLAIGGLQQVVVSICKTIDRDKFDVSVLCLKDLGDFTPEVESLGIKVYHLPQNVNGTDYFSFKKVSKLLNKLQIDILHTHNTQPFIDGTIGTLLSGKRRTIVHTDHARPFPDKKRYMFLEWLMSHFAYKVVGVSKDTTRKLLRYEKMSPNKVLTILNGIDTSKYSIAINKKNKKIELGLPDDGFIIGLGVRLAEQKGISYLLKATKELLKRYKTLHLLIAGEGPLESRLKDEAKKLSIADKVKFLGPRLDLHEILQILDIYILPSIWEGLPMVILEAMAAGCPVIASNVGGIPEIIKQNKNGLLFEPKNIEQIIFAVNKLLSEKELRKKFSYNNIKSVKNEYSAEIMTKKYQKLYLRE